MEVNKLIAKRELEILGGIPKVTRYWNDDNSRSIDILSCEDRPYVGVKSYATIGLSQSDIEINSGIKPLRIELLGVCDIKEDEFINVIESVAFEITKRGKCHYGQLIKNAITPSEKNVDLKHIYLMEPYLWDGFDNMEFENYNVTWLLVIPISENEMNYAIKHGSDKLESLLEKNDIDIFNLSRASVI